jgi:microcystin-dependent protein
MDAFTGEIRAFGFPFPPLDWAFCNGQSVSQQQFQALYSIIGQMYGGSSNTFNLPNLQGRAAMDQGTGSGLTPRRVGETDGVTDVTLTLSQMPAHSHAVCVVNSNVKGDAKNVADPANAYWACGYKNPSKPLPFSSYLAPQAPATATPMAALAIQASGSQTPLSHSNMQPYQVVNMCICMNGIYPVKP